MTKFLYLTDTHYGFERHAGTRRPLHDARAIRCALQFAHDFKPDVVILGGDILDCGAISHHNHGKPGRTEGLRLLADAQVCREQFITPLEQLKATQYYYIEGNHEDWLHDLVIAAPGLEGLLDIERLLDLDARWQVLPQGSKLHLGKLTFVHGDQLKGGQSVAKNAVIEAERSIRFGHFHTYQAWTKTSFVEEKLGRTGIAVPCLCSKDPKYGEGRGNSWVQGFCYGYIMPDGTYADYVPIITNGRLIVNGKVYK